MTTTKDSVPRRSPNSNVRVEFVQTFSKSRFLAANRTSGSTNPYVYVMENFNSKLLRLQSLRKNFRLKLPGVDLDSCSHCAAPAPDIDSKSLRTSVFRKNHGLSCFFVLTHRPFICRSVGSFSIRPERGARPQCRDGQNCPPLRCLPVFRLSRNSQDCRQNPRQIECGDSQKIDVHKGRPFTGRGRRNACTSESLSLREIIHDSFQSSLWICSNCSMTVHACCYGIDEQNTGNTVLCNTWNSMNSFR